MRSFSLLAVLAAIVVALALVPATSATTEPNALKLVDVTVSANGAKFQRYRLERGTIADFRIKNRTKRPVRLLVADVRSAVVKPGQTTAFFVHLNVRGKIPWAVLLGAKRADRGALTIY